MTPATDRFHPPASLPACALTSLNALNHGGAAETLFLPSEDPSVFFANLDDAFSHYQPGNAEESDMVTNSVHARWMFSRRQRALTFYEFELHKCENDPTAWHKKALDQLDLLDRYKTNSERALRRALINVHSIRQDAARTQHWQELLALRKQSLALQVEKWEHTKKARDAKQAKEDRAEEALLKKNPPFESILTDTTPRPGPLQNLEEYDGSVIVQSAIICVTPAGNTYIDELEPTNRKVRTMILHRASYANPPQQVVREFSFSDGIPDEYEFLIDKDFPRPDEDDCHISCALTFEEWETLAAKEDQIIASQPDDPDEDDDPDNC
jgi:hypothetical protein